MVALRTLVQVAAGLLLVAGIALAIGCGSADRDDPATELTFLAVPALDGREVPPARMNRAATVLEGRAESMLGADVEVRWDRDGGDWVRVTTSGPVEEPAGFAAAIATPGRPQILPVRAIGTASYASLFAAVQASDEIAWTPPASILYPAGVTRRFLFGPAPEREALISLSGSPRAMDAAIDAVFPDGPPPGSLVAEMPQGMEPWSSSSDIGTQGVRATRWFLAGPSADGLLVGPRRAVFSESDPVIGRHRMVYQLVTRDRELLLRNFRRSSGLNEAVVPAHLVVDRTIISAADSTFDRLGSPGELVFEDIPEEDRLLVEAMLESGPLGVQLTPVPPTP